LLPRFNVRASISFLVDTGADMTSLYPLDGARMGLDYSKLDPNKAITITGATGTNTDYLEDAVAVFLDFSGRLCMYAIQIVVSTVSGGSTTPTLLGRNVLDHWRLHYEPRAPRLEAFPLIADAFVPVDMSAIGHAPFAVADRPE